MDAWGPYGSYEGYVRFFVPRIGVEQTCMALYGDSYPQYVRGMARYCKDHGIEAGGVYRTDSGPLPKKKHDPRRFYGGLSYTICDQEGRTR